MDPTGIRQDGYDAELCYLRDWTGKEVDFLVTLKGRPSMAVEVKVSETAVDPSLVYFRDRLKIPFAQPTPSSAPCRERLH